ncbi:hypothetical protein EOD73_14695 [Inhella crocodyli]|uniref:Uncharacterized protein n=1 Tax=Inhella crocodyli TaxID=2499851 RepID=A0A437LEM6_9BURK|nr:hypothetical protein EOD73_14695 [Inhella crocodyli]
MTSNSAHLTLSLTEDEALVLSAFFARFEKDGEFSLASNAEFIAFSAVSRQIDQRLVQPFQDDYCELVSQARNRLQQGTEGLLPGVQPRSEA